MNMITERLLLREFLIKNGPRDTRISFRCHNRYNEQWRTATKTNSDSQLWQLAVIATIDNGHWQSAVEFQCNEETQMFLFVDIDLKASQGNSSDKQQTNSKQTTNKKHQQTIIKTNK